MDPYTLDSVVHKLFIVAYHLGITFKSIYMYMLKIYDQTRNVQMCFKAKITSSAMLRLHWFACVYIDEVCVHAF